MLGAGAGQNLTDVDEDDSETDHNALTDFKAVDASVDVDAVHAEDA